MTGDEFKAYCLETCKTQEFAATNTPQRIDVSEPTRQTLCGMVRCMFVDGGLRPFLSGEFMITKLIMTASYFCNRIPRSALEMETPYTMLYGKNADLWHLIIICVRAFLHIRNAN